MLSIKLLLEHIEIRKENDWTIAKLYNTDIVLFSKDRIVLNAISPTGIKWYTWTTKRAMNAIAGYYGLHYHVYQKNFKWFVNHNHVNRDYVDFMNLEQRK